MDLKETMELLKIISKVFGPYFGALFSMTLLGIIMILIFFKKRIENIANDISIKSMKTFELTQSLSVRNEQIREELMIYLGKKSIDMKLLIYEEINKLYFRFQETWELIKDVDKNKEELDKIWKEILEMRRKIFLNSIYLGGKLTEIFLNIVLAMWNILENNIHEKTNNIFYRMGVYSHHEGSTLNSMKDVYKNLDLARDYMTRNLNSHQDIEQFDFTESQKKLLEKEREKIFKEM
jgi:hypothetical protein